MQLALLIGRLIFGGYFTYNGVNHFLSHSMMAGYAASKGVPAPEIAVWTAGLMILFGGLSILLGLRPYVGALLIVLFLAVVSPMMHNFWAIADPAQRLAEMTNFTKNMALLGASLMMLGIPVPWRYSVDDAVARAPWRRVGA